MKVILLISGVVFSIVSFGQTGTVNVSKFTLFNPGVAFELKTNRFQTVYAHLYAATSFGINISSSQGTDAFLNFDPAAALQYRFYYNGEKRTERGKRTELNSMNYIAPLVDVVLTRASISQEYVVAFHRRPLVQGGVVWGMQRNYPKRFSLDLNVGPGFYFIESTRQAADDVIETSTTGGLTVLLNVTIGWWLNRR